MTSKEKNFYITRPNDGSVIFHRIILFLVSQATFRVSNNKKMWNSWQKYIIGMHYFHWLYSFLIYLIQLYLIKCCLTSYALSKANVIWMFYKTLANFYIFGIFLPDLPFSSKLTLSKGEYPLNLCQLFVVPDSTFLYSTFLYLPFLSKSPMLKGPLSTSHKTFRHIFGEILPYSPFLSKSLLLKEPLSTSH